MQNINFDNLDPINPKNRISHAQLVSEIQYVQAQQILESLLEDGLLSLSEFNEITMLNRQCFSPALASIMPDKR